MSDISTILTAMGYSLVDNGPDFRARPIYRESNNATSLKIDKKTGRFVDFSAQITGSFEDLIKLSLGLKSRDDAEKWLEENHAFKLIIVNEKPKLKVQKKFDDSNLNELIPDHSYWINRGISEETMTLFRGGVSKTGKTKDRYVFPIFNSKNEIIGFAARDLLKGNDKRPKWKLIGDKAEWKYPLFLNIREIQAKGEVILVESIGDMLSLWDAGIRNVVVIFGVMLSSPVLSLLLKIDPARIIISLNNDSDNGNVGQNASVKIYQKLNKFFDKHQLSVKTPVGAKDFNEMSKEQIIAWKNS